MINKYKWIILTLTFFAFATVYMPRMLYPPLIPEMSVALNLTNSEAGMLMSGFFMGYLAMQLPIGYVSDKIGAKRIFTVSLVLAGILCIFTGFATSFSNAIVFRFTNGLAAGCIFAPGSALILRWFPPKDRAIAISIFQTSVSVGSFIPLFSSAVISSLLGSWRWSFWVFGIPSLIVAIPSFLLLKEKPKEDFDGNFSDVETKEISHSTGLVLRDQRIWLLCIATVGGGVAYMGSLTWIPTYLVRIINLPEIYAGTITSFVALTGILGTPIAGFIADRILHKRIPIIFFGILLSGLSCILFSILMPTNLYPAAVLFILISFFSATWWIASSSLSEWLPPHSLGTAIGFLNFMTISGCVLGPFIFGAILDLTGSFSFGWFTLGSIATITALLMLPMTFNELRGNG